eukprot:scaffold128323_cov27-Tisochrysis_lutea.AAC.5
MPSFKVAARSADGMAIAVSEYQASHHIESDHEVLWHTFFMHVNRLHTPPRNGAGTSYSTHVWATSALASLFFASDELRSLELQFGD